MSSNRVASLRAQEEAWRYSAADRKREIEQIDLAMARLTKRRLVAHSSLHEIERRLGNFGKVIYESVSAEVRLPVEIIRLILFFYFRLEGVTRTANSIGVLWPLAPTDLKVALSILDPAFGVKVKEVAPYLTRLLVLKTPRWAGSHHVWPGWKRYMISDSLKELVTACYAPVVLRTSLAKVTVFGPRAMILFECSDHERVLELLRSEKGSLLGGDKEWPHRKGFKKASLRAIGEHGFGIPWPGKACACFTEKPDCQSCTLRYLINTISKRIILYNP